MIAWWLVAGLVQLAGPDNQVIWVNPGAVVSLRQPRNAEHFSRGTRCLLQMSDGHFIAVQNFCDDVRRALDAQPR